MNVDLSLEDLSGSEIVARLTNRGVPIDHARALVARRNDPVARYQILLVLASR